MDVSTALGEPLIVNVPAVDGLVLENREVLEAVPLRAGLRVLWMFTRNECASFVPSQCCSDFRRVRLDSESNIHPIHITQSQLEWTLHHAPNSARLELDAHRHYTRHCKEEELTMWISSSRTPCPV